MASTHHVGGAPELQKKDGPEVPALFKKTYFGVGLPYGNPVLLALLLSVRSGNGNESAQSNAALECLNVLHSVLVSR